MKINQTYRSLLDKSINSMLSAIEIYNKPNFAYREETFAILAVNSLELLFKAHLFKIEKYNMKSLQVLIPYKNKNGKEHKTRKTPKVNRSGNCITIGILEVLTRLANKGISINKNFLANIELLIELRDNAIHFHNGSEISKQIQEIGFATIKNYINIIKLWEIDIDISSYNLYLMPLAYVDSKIISTGVLTDEVKNYLEYAKEKINKAEDDDNDFGIAISIDVSFKKENSFGEIGFKYDENGIEIKLTEENIRQNYPLSYKDVTSKAKGRYLDFKQDDNFHKLMKSIKGNRKITHQRHLDPNKPKATSKFFYSANIWKELDKHYTKK